MSSQKIKTHCLNWMPGKCTWFKVSVERDKLHLPLISFCSNKSFSHLLILETKKWDLGMKKVWDVGFS